MRARRPFQNACLLEISMKLPAPCHFNCNSTSQPFALSTCAVPHPHSPSYSPHYPSFPSAAAAAGPISQPWPLQLDLVAIHITEISLMKFKLLTPTQGSSSVSSSFVSSRTSAALRAAARGSSSPAADDEPAPNVRAGPPTTRLLAGSGAVGACGGAESRVRPCPAKLSSLEDSLPQRAPIAD